ncbi:MAG: hypothetical protein JW982_16685 [Spirochaetes bacterium]|nr:hypothetical protein [Spirochaetota bacterium]
MKQLLFAFIIFLISVSCLAEEDKKKDDREPYGWVISPGAVYVYQDDDNYMLGAEISMFNAVHSFNTFDIFFYGAYFDVIFDSDNKAVKYSIGPELGITPFGIDGGLVILNSEDKTEFGYSARVFFTLPPVGCCHGFGPPFILYYRYNSLSEFNDNHEFGVLWKLPIPLKSIN